MMEAGFLRGDDLFWLDELPQHRPLAELPGFLKAQEVSLLQKVKGTVLSAAGVVKGGATAVVSKVSAAAGRGHTEVAIVTTMVLEDYLPSIREYVVAAVKQSSRSVGTILRDESFMRKVFGAVYDMLPKPVRRFVSEQDFIAFCLEHQQSLLKEEQT